MPQKAGENINPQKEKVQINKAGPAITGTINMRKSQSEAWEAQTKYNDKLAMSEWNTHTHRNTQGVGESRIEKIK